MVSSRMRGENPYTIRFCGLVGNSKLTKEGLGEVRICHSPLTQPNQKRLANALSAGIGKLVWLVILNLPHPLDSDE